MINTTGVTDCPFCRSNGLLKGEVLAEATDAYLLENFQFLGNYLIIPENHTESLADLPDDWWRSVKELLPRIPGLGTNYNLSFNIGREAGQTVKHLHLWVIPRSTNQPTSGKGMISLLNPPR